MSVHSLRTRLIFYISALVLVTTGFLIFNYSRITSFEEKRGDFLQQQVGSFLEHPTLRGLLHKS
jgi:hypothetical protein